MERNDDPSGYTANCDQGRDNRRSDLCAQWKAADAATESARWTRLAFFLGLGGIAIGLGTLVAASAAAYFAKKAAEHTEVGAQAATDSVAETRRIGEAQVRCYINIAKAWVTVGPKNVVTFQVELKNSGQTPATEVRVAYKGDFRPVETTNPNWSKIDSAAANEPLPANSSLMLAPWVFHRPMTGAEYVTFSESENGLVIMLVVQVTARDVFGAPVKSNNAFMAVAQRWTRDEPYELTHHSHTRARIRMERLRRGKSVENG